MHVQTHDCFQSIIPGIKMLDSRLVMFQTVGYCY